MNYSRYSIVFSSVPALFPLGLPKETHFYNTPQDRQLGAPGVIGGLVAALAEMRMFWNQIKGFFRKLLHVGRNHAEHEESGE